MKRITMILVLLSVLLLPAARTAAQDNTIKKTTGYAGIAYGINSALKNSSLGGLTLMLGGIWQNHDLQVAYTLGLEKTPLLYWYDGNGDVDCSLQYKRHSLAIKYGYQVQLASGLALTPQAGVSYEQLEGVRQTGSNDLGNGADAWCFTAGLKLTYSPLQHTAFFFSPEYKSPISKNPLYDDVSDKCKISKGGLAIHAGVLFFL